MSYGDEIPIREDLLALAVPLIEKHRGRLVVIDYDIQLQSWIQPGPQPSIVNAWCIVLVTPGALVGRENWLDYTWTFHHTPSPPDEEELESGIQQAFQRLALMQTRQLQKNNPGTAGQN